MSATLAVRLAALERSRVARSTERAPAPIDAASVRELLGRLLTARPEDRDAIVRAHRQAARSVPSTDSGARERVMRRLDALAERWRERQEHDAR